MPIAMTMSLSTPTRTQPWILWVYQTQFCSEEAFKMIALWNWLLKTTIGRDFSLFDSNKDCRMNSLFEMTTLLIAFMAKQLLDIEYPLDCWIYIRLLVACCSNLWLQFETSLIESNQRIGSMLSWQGRQLIYRYYNTLHSTRGCYAKFISYCVRGYP